MEYLPAKNSDAVILGPSTVLRAALNVGTRAPSSVLKAVLNVPHFQHNLGGFYSIVAFCGIWLVRPTFNATKRLSPCPCICLYLCLCVRLLHRSVWFSRSSPSGTTGFDAQGVGAKRHGFPLPHASDRQGAQQQGTGELYLLKAGSTCGLFAATVVAARFWCCLCFLLPGALSS